MYAYKVQFEVKHDLTLKIYTVYKIIVLLFRSTRLLKKEKRLYYFFKDIETIFLSFSSKVVGN